MFENEVICTECGGKCCRKYPGACFPSDFGLPNTDKLDAALKSGNYAIDWWEGDPRPGKSEICTGYFVRPATKDALSLFDASWGGPCTFLTDAGCELTIENRPLNCRMLEPKRDDRCVLHENASKQDAAIAWIPYHDLLESYRS